MIKFQYNKCFCINDLFSFWLLDVFRSLLSEVCFLNSFRIFFSKEESVFRGMFLEGLFLESCSRGCLEFIQSVVLFSCISFWLVASAESSVMLTWSSVKSCPLYCSFRKISHRAYSELIQSLFRESLH